MSASWGRWIKRYGSRGYHVLAPPWPGMDGDVDNLCRRASPVDDLAVTEIVNHYAGIIRELGEAPIIIGHGFGGLITQLLVGQGLGGAGVVLDLALTRPAPLLVIGSEIEPNSLPSLPRHWIALTTHTRSAGRSHDTVDRAGWEDVADYVLRWALEHANAHPTEQGYTA